MRSAEYEEPDEGVPDMLLAMRVVAKTDKSPGEQGLVKQMRKWFSQDAKGFFEEMVKLERSYISSKGRMAGVAVGDDGDGPAMVEEKKVEDIGTAACVELCEKLIKEFTAQGEEKKDG